MVAQASKIISRRTAQDPPIYRVLGPMAGADKLIPLPSVHDASQVTATSRHCYIIVPITVYNNVLVKRHSLWQVQGQPLRILLTPHAVQSSLNHGTEKQCQERKQSTSNPLQEFPSSVIHIKKAFHAWTIIKPLMQLSS
jgi:hypothetical protein